MSLGDLETARRMGLSLRDRRLQQRRLGLREGAAAPDVRRRAPTSPPTWPRPTTPRSPRPWAAPASASRTRATWRRRFATGARHARRPGRHRRGRHPRSGADAARRRQPHGRRPRRATGSPDLPRPVRVQDEKGSQEWEPVRTIAEYERRQVPRSAGRLLCRRAAKLQGHVFLAPARGQSDDSTQDGDDSDFLADHGTTSADMLREAYCADRPPNPKSGLEEAVPILWTRQKCHVTRAPRGARFHRELFR